MEDKLFNHKKGFNIKFFEETLRGTAGNDMFKAFGKGKKVEVKAVSEEVVESGEEDPEEEEVEEKLPETNESNVNKVDGSI